MRRVALSLALLGMLSSAAEAEDVYINAQQLSAEELRQQDLKIQEEKRIREETARREQQAVDAELDRRGWPRSREGEVRKFLQVQKEAAALKPRPGAGSLLVESSNAQDEWARRREDAAGSGKKSNCWTEEKPPLVAIGFSRVSEADARNIALENTKGCRVVAEMFCTSTHDVTFNPNGTMNRGAKRWDCRTSYQCGETQTRCQNESAPASAQ